MNIAIGEDKAQDREAIRSILDDYIKQNGYVGEISVFVSGEELLDTLSLGLFDVIFLDIYMGCINGIETAKRIREIDPTCVIIFITSSKDHSLESYSVRGSAYVIKPIREKEMQNALFQCREIFLRNALYIEIRADRTDVKIPLIKIYYVEIFGNYALFHTIAGEYKARMTLDEVEQKLGGKPFYRCHQSYIINSNHVGGLGGNDIMMKNGDAVPMRKNGRDAIRTELAAVMSSRMFEV
jgi:DNA-binding LytR/AlgR family response regulator